MVQDCLCAFKTAVKSELGPYVLVIMFTVGQNGLSTADEMAS